MENKEKKEKQILVDSSEKEIKMSFHNYKLLKQADFDLKGSSIYFVKGPNEVGKTTILNGLRAVQEIKDDTPEKLTRGTTEGRNEFTIPGPDGKDYTILYEFTNDKTKFIIIDSDGNKIDKITEMREIFGYQHINARDFINWSKTAEGRRKQKQLILELLPPDDYLKYSDLEEKEKDMFDKRTNINRKIDEVKNVVSQFEVSDEEIQALDKEDKAKSLLKNYTEQLDKLKPGKDKIDTLNDRWALHAKELSSLEDAKDDTLTSNQSTIENNKEEIISIHKEIERLNIKADELVAKNMSIKEQNEKLQEKYMKHVNEIKDEQKKIEDEIKTLQDSSSTEKIDEINQSIDKGHMFIQKVSEIKLRKEKYDKFKEELDEYTEKVNEWTDIIEKARKEKEKIITSGNFPVESLSFDEKGYLTIDGFKFDESQVCESDTILLVSEILCKTNRSIIQVIGDASVLDFKKLDKLNEIAEKNGKVMFVDEVDRSLDKLVIVGYEELRQIKKKPSAKKADTKKDDKEKEENDEKLF